MSARAVEPKQTTDRTASAMRAARRVVKCDMIVLLFSFVFPRSMWRHLSCDRCRRASNARDANEAGAHAPTRKIRLGEVARGARGSSSPVVQRFGRSFATRS